MILKNERTQKSLCEKVEQQITIRMGVDIIEFIIFK